MTRKKIAFVAAILLLALAYASTNLPDAYASSIALSPNHGPVGTIVHITGGGFPGGSVDVYWGSIYIQSCGTGPNPPYPIAPGCQFNVPSSTQGIHTVNVTDYTFYALASFTVTSSLVLASTSGKVGNSVTANGSGFAKSASIHFNWDGAPLASPSCTSNGTGSFPCTFTVPPSPAGSHTVNATDGTNSATATFTLSITSTSLSMSCSPTTVPKGSPTTCKATASPSSAIGIVAWSADKLGAFNSTSCTVSSGSCSVKFVPSISLTIVNINATYSGSGFTNSSASFPIAVPAASSDFSSPILLPVLIISGVLFISLVRRGILTRRTLLSVLSENPK